MKLFALSDTHLCTTNPEKDMSVFGEIWQNHPLKIKSRWESVVGDDDIVLISGDICWAMKFEEGLQELQFLSTLPGEKVFIKGNHDFWWQSIKKVRSLAPSRMHFIQNSTVEIGKFGIGGTKLWNFDFINWPCIIRNKEMDEEKAARGETIEQDVDWLAKIRKRELDRLDISLSKISRSSTIKIAMVHFPPIDEEGNSNEITNLMTRKKIDICVYGHLHSVGGKPKGSDCVIDKTRYVLTSSDFLNFYPNHLATL